MVFSKIPFVLVNFFNQPQNVKIQVVPYNKVFNLLPSKSLLRILIVAFILNCGISGNLEQSETTIHLAHFSKFTKKTNRNSPFFYDDQLCFCRFS